VATQVYVQQHTQPTHPHRGAGIALLIIGILLLVVGIALAAYCSVSFFGTCLDNPYAGVGGGLAALGFILLIIGIVLMVVTGPPAAPVQPAVVYVQQPPPYTQAQPVFAQQPTAYVPQPPAPQGTERYCPSCGAGNAKVAGFCTRCGRPLPPPPSS